MAENFTKHLWYDVPCSRQVIHKFKAANGGIVCTEGLIACKYESVFAMDLLGSFYLLISHYFRRGR